MVMVRGIILLIILSVLSHKFTVLSLNFGVAVPV